MKDYNGFSGEERMSSYNKLKYKIQKGEVEDWKNKPCEICGLQSPTNMAHQEDYANHKHYHTLCVECHMKLHGRFSKPFIWLRHLNDVKNGYVSTPYNSANHYFSTQKRMQKQEFEKNIISPLELGDEWFHKLSMQKINLKKEENTIKYE